MQSQRDHGHDVERGNPPNPEARNEVSVDGTLVEGLPSLPLPSREMLAAIAAEAALSVDGVSSLAARGPGRGLRMQDITNGVRVHMLDGRAAFDVRVVAGTAVVLLNLASDIRRAVIERIESQTSVRVTEVNGLTLLVEPAGAAMREGDMRWKA